MLNEEPVRDARRRQERVGGRDQEGVPQARSPVPPGQEPGRRCRRGAVQGGSERLRPALRAEKRQAVRPLRVARTAGPGPGGGFNWSTTEGVDFGDLGDLFGGMFGGGVGGGGRPTPAQRGNDVEVQVNLSFEDCAEGRRGEDPGRARGRVPHVPRLGREAGDGAEGLPAVRRPRRDRREPGLLRALPAVPALPRERHDIEEPCPTCRGTGPRAADEALHGEDPGGRQGRLAHPPEGQGRGGLERRAGGRPLRRHARRALQDVHAARRRPARRRPRPVHRRSARHDREGADPRRRPGLA